MSVVGSEIAKKASQITGVCQMKAKHVGTLSCAFAFQISRVAEEMAYAEEYVLFFQGPEFVT